MGLGAIVDRIPPLESRSLGDPGGEQGREIGLGRDEVVGVGDVDPASDLHREGGGLGAEPGVDDRVQAEGRAEGDQKRQRPVEVVDGLVGDNSAERMRDDNLGVGVDEVEHRFLGSGADGVVGQVARDLGEGPPDELLGKGHAHQSEPAELGRAPDGRSGDGAGPPVTRVRVRDG